MKVYSARDVARFLDLSVDQVRSYAKDGLLDPERGPRGEYRFSFQDVVLLRTAKGLVGAQIPARKVKRALKRLKGQLPRDRPLTGVQIAARGDEVVVREGGTVWDPDSGQTLFNFDVRELAEKIAPHAVGAVQTVDESATETGAELSAEDWFDLGSDLENATPEHARDAYRRALELDPLHVASHVNLGRLLQEEKKLAAAEAHYRIALRERGTDSTALFNLAVCLEEQSRVRDALALYEKTVQIDPTCADAHYNLSQILERRGDRAGALRHLQIYRRLTRSH